MLNFDRIIRLAAQASGQKALVAAPYGLSGILCRSLATEGVISGFIGEMRPNPECHDLAIAGWWTDRKRGKWFIRNRDSRTIIFLSASTGEEITGQMLLECRLKGIQRVLLVAEDGSVIRKINVVSALMKRLLSGRFRDQPGELSYDDLFDDIYSLVGDRLRLPAAALIRDRILLVTGSLDAGGAERQVSYTAVNLAKRFPGKVYIGQSNSGGDFDFFKAVVESGGVKICTMPQSSDDYNAPNIIAIRNQLASKYRGLGVQSIFDMIFHHALLLRDIRPGLVHTWQEYSNILGGIAADMVGVPRLVLSGRSVAPDNFAIFQPYMAPGYRALLKRRSVVFLNNSNAGARDYARWLNVSRQMFRVVHNGFEFPEVSEKLRAAKRQEFEIPEGVIVVGSITRFSEEKRPELLLDIARTLQQSRPKVRFLVFGAGPQLEYSRAWVEANNLVEIVKLPGLTTDSWAALSAMDVFILTSRMEGLPNVMIEAQGMGLPVVCTGAGGMSETFVEGETGLSVPSANVEELAEAIARLIDNPSLRARMGQNARRHAHKAFGMERMIDETLDAYRSTVEHKTNFVWNPDWEDWNSATSVRVVGCVRDQGYGFVAPLPVGIDVSVLELWEDDHRIGPRTRSCDDVCRVGSGRYAIENDQIIYSSSDGTDVRFNGRTYRLQPKQASHEFDDVFVKSESIAAERGHCFIADLGLSERSARYALWENDKCLGPSVCLHDEIRRDGNGRYCVWNENLYFSSSDNSDPRSNQRVYVLRRRKMSAPVEGKTAVFAKGSLDGAMRHLTRNGVPRQDFVPGRIVHVGGSLGPGGAERQQLYTLSGLAKGPGESAQLLCYYLGATQTDRFDFYLPAFKAAGIPVRAIRRQVGRADLGSMPGPVRDVRNVLPGNLATDIADLYWEFVDLRPEVVHAWLDGNNERAGFAAALAGVPRIILSGRNLNPTHFNFYEPYMDFAYKALLDLPHVIMINNSQAGAHDYADWLGVDHHSIRVIYNGVDFGSRGRLSPAEIEHERDRLSIDPTSFVVGGVFRFAAEKRPLLWIEAAAEVAHRLLNARFILFGYGEMRPAMEKAAKDLGLGDRLHFAGVTSDILGAVSLMDVLLLTSKVEGLPNVVLEAQWVGTPVVATAAGGTAEAIEHGSTGWLVDPPTGVALADQIQWLHDNPAIRKAVQARGPALVRQRFGIANMIEKMLDVYAMSGTKPGVSS